MKENKIIGNSSFRIPMILLGIWILTLAFLKLYHDEMDEIIRIAAYSSQPIYLLRLSNMTKLEKMNKYQLSLNWQDIKKLKIYSESHSSSGKEPPNFKVIFCTSMS